MKHQHCFRHFLECYARKDIDGISRMLADDVSLRDWDISVRGRSAVESATRKNFEDAASIEIEVLRVYESPNTVAGELRIVVDEAIELFVVDVIQFHDDGLIGAIRSYKGRAD
jgi:ketosteroid isomerase-like protein